MNKTGIGLGLMLLGAPFVGWALSFQPVGGGVDLGGSYTFSGSNTFSGTTRITGQFQVDGGSITINESSADIDIRVESDGNENGLYFDGGIKGGQGGLGIGVVPADKLDIQIGSAASEVVQFENTSTSGYASWRAKSNGTTETVDYGVGGSAVGGNFQDYAFINASSGLSGLRFFTNAGTLALTISNTQVVTFSTTTVMYSRSTAELAALAPAAALHGVINSTTFIACISTGTGIGAWVRTSDGATACD